MQHVFLFKMYYCVYRYFFALCLMFKEYLFEYANLLYVASYGIGMVMIILGSLVCARSAWDYDIDWYELCWIVGGSAIFLMVLATCFFKI